jgi:hypothetical protein
MIKRWDVRSNCTYSKWEYTHLIRYNALVDGDKDHTPKRNKIDLLPLSPITIKILESMKEPCNGVSPTAVDVTRIFAILVWALS